MKSSLKRIEATLHQLAVRQHRVPKPRQSAPRPVQALKPPALPLPTAQAPGSDWLVEFDGLTKRMLAAAPRASGTAVTPPVAPAVQPSQRSDHLLTTDPTLALRLLKELETIISTWMAELKQVLEQIQALYQEGPIVDGWLESYGHGKGILFPTMPPQSGTLGSRASGTTHHPSIDAGQASAIPDLAQTNPALTGYRLCGVNSQGQFWFRHCPVEQVADVGLAISRYQRLQQLLNQKRLLEQQLVHSVEVLADSHSRLTP